MVMLTALDAVQYRFKFLKENYNTMWLAGVTVAFQSPKLQGWGSNP